MSSKRMRRWRAGQLVDDVIEVGPVPSLFAATAAEAQQQIEDLAVQKEEADARLKQVRDECEQDEALLNSLRQQIIEHEKRIVEEEARHASLNAASAVLSAKHQRDEAAVKAEMLGF